MSVVTVRRSTDDATKSFTASEVEDGTLQSWVTEGSATADGFATLIDQSGNGATPHPADAEQPKIVDAGTLVEDFVEGVVLFDGTDDGYVTDVQSAPSYTVAARANPTGGARQTIASADGLLVYVDGSGTLKARITDGTTTAVVSTARHLGMMEVVATVDADTLVLQVGGEVVSTAHSISRTQTGKFSAGIEPDGTNPMTGELEQAYAWPTFYSAAQRDDLSSRHMNPYVPLPEPWSEVDMQSIERGKIYRNVFDWAGNDLDQPGFLLDYENLPPVIPDNLQSNHVRASVATRWDKNGNLVEGTADTLRLQRDPATQAVQGLLYEPKRTQLLGSPVDITSADWAENSVSTSSNVGSAKGQSFDSLTEDTTTGTEHSIRDASAIATDGEPVAMSMIVKANGRNWCFLEPTLYDGTSTETPKYWFDLSSGVIGTTETPTNGTNVSHTIQDLGNGWYRCKVVLNPNSGWKVQKPSIGLADLDGSDSYDGDGSSGIYVMHAQIEESREVTTPILQGGGVREADEVNYRFSFPDVTTGVAYSIEQQAGGDMNANSELTFGLTSHIYNADHGALMEVRGIENQNIDGWLTGVRNSDEPAGGRSVKDETVDRFRVNLSNSPDQVTWIVRQIAIWTQTLTSTQKSDLESNYLTTP